MLSINRTSKLQPCTRSISSSNSSSLRCSPCRRLLQRLSLPLLCPRLVFPTDQQITCGHQCRSIRTTGDRKVSHPGDFVDEVANGVLIEDDRQPSTYNSDAHDRRRNYSFPSSSGRDTDRSSGPKRPYQSDQSFRNDHRTNQRRPSPVPKRRRTTNNVIEDEYHE